VLLADTVQVLLDQYLPQHTFRFLFSQLWPEANSEPYEKH